MSNEPIIFIGPGSEWFWSMAQFVVVAVTLVGIYYQLRVARSANAFEQMNRIFHDMESERMCRNMLAIVVALRDGVSPESLPPGPAAYLADQWEQVGGLVKAGHIDRRLCYESLGHSVQWWWATLAPDARRYRDETGDVTAGANFEWLAGAMAELSRAAGVPIAIDAAHQAAGVERRIATLLDKIRIAEELRAVTIRTEPSAAFQNG